MSDAENNEQRGDEEGPAEQGPEEAEASAEQPTPTPTPASEPEPAVDGEALAKELESWKTRAYRAAADLENTKRRFGKEREDLRKFGIEGMLKDLFPVIDNLERAVQHADADNPIAEGVRMVLRQFNTVLGNRGAKAFDAKGEKFDPTVHEAMTQIVTSEVEPGHVAEVFQRGWMLHDRLVRPAMVVVAKAPEPSENATEPPAESVQADAAEVDAEAPTDEVDESAEE